MSIKTYQVHNRVVWTVLWSNTAFRISSRCQLQNLQKSTSTNAQRQMRQMVKEWAHPHRPFRGGVMTKAPGAPGCCNIWASERQMAVETQTRSHKRATEVLKKVRKKRHFTNHHLERLTTHFETSQLKGKDKTVLPFPEALYFRETKQSQLLSKTKVYRRMSANNLHVTESERPHSQQALQ